jgi:hypothetical protein
VQETATQWLWIYNNGRTHMGLGGITPKQKLALDALPLFLSELKNGVLGGLPLMYCM